jgi:HEPN domain-containing protein
MALEDASRPPGMEVFKMHDVGFVLRKHSAIFPEWFQGGIDRMAGISRALRGQRETSLYADDRLALPPEAVFAKVDADEAVRDAGLVMALCQRLFEDPA